MSLGMACECLGTSVCMYGAVGRRKWLAAFSPRQGTVVGFTEMESSGWEVLRNWKQISA